jgi:teichuronic acid exporter
MVRSVAWTGAVKWTMALFTWVATIIVARLLTPDDYGLVGMAAILLGLLTILTEFGLGITVVTLRDLTHTQISQLNGLSVLLGFLAALLCLLLAVPAGAFFRAPELPLVIIVLSGSFLISSLRTIPASLMQRDLAFKALALTEGGYGLVQGGATITLAWLGLGYWALVLGPIIGQFIYTVAVLAQRRHAFAVPRRQQLGTALSFTRHQLTGSVAYYSYSNADSLIVGRLLGSAYLGVYTISFMLARAIPEKVSALVGRVTPAFFSAVQDDPAALRRYLLKLTEYLSLLMFPAMAGVAVIASDIVAVIGPQWSEAVTPLRVLAVFAAFEGVLQLVHRVLTARRRSRFLMYDGLALAVIMPLGFLVGSRWGVTGVALTWMAVYPLTRVPALRVVCRETGLRMAEYLRAYLPASAGCGVMILALVMVQPALAAWPLAARLGVQVLLGAAVYVVFIAALYPDRVRGLRQLAAHLRR